MGPANPLRRFTGRSDGVAAIEFALIAPFLLLTILSSYDIGRALSVYIKVRSAAAALATITNQYTTGTNGIDASDMQAITGATAAILSPFPTGSAITKISQIKMTSAANSVVSWSYATRAAHTGPDRPGRPCRRSSRRRSRATPSRAI